MKVEGNYFGTLMDGSKQFIIPVFQRDYGWSEGNCDQLFADVLSAGIGDGEVRHFIGSVVYVDSGDSGAAFSRWLLIDGQQRITTISLLVIALRDHIEETKFESPSGDPDADQLHSYFLRNVNEKRLERQDKLVLRRADRDAFHSLLVKGERPSNTASRVFDNYERFRELLVDADLRRVFLGLTRLFLVDVRLDKSDDPQLVFESLNSTGVALQQSDLIRNYVLMRLPEAEQSRLYQDYWSKIEDLFRGSDGTFDVFVRDFLALDTGATRQIRGDRVYEAFRGYFKPSNAGPEMLLARMLKVARFHAAVSMGRGEKSATIARALSRLNRLLEVSPMVIVRLLMARETGTLNDTELLEGIALLESYVFRRTICGGQTRGYWETFARLAHSIDLNQPLVSLKVAMAGLRESYRFPTDEDFCSALQTKDIYGMRACSYMLERLENFSNKEPTDLSECTIEHVMPQNENLDISWQTMLGPNWKEIQATWVHRLGNLTLTGYNSKYSDRSFVDKKSIADGFDESTLRLNAYFREQASWNKEAIETRGRALAYDCLRVWKPLHVPPDALQAAANAELKKRASARSTDQVAMGTKARALFELLSKAVAEFGGVYEIAETKSVSYHSGDFFAEVLPRKHALFVLLDLPFNECVDPFGIAKDQSDWTFVPNAKYAGGTHCYVKSDADLMGAIHLMRQACEQSRK